MRFVSKHPKYSIQFQSPIVENYVSGESRVTRPMINCEFQHFASLYAHEVDYAMSHFTFRGGVLEADGITPVTNMTRLSVFDTVMFAREQGLDDATRERLELHMLANSEHGKDFVMVAEPKLDPPWPGYAKVRDADKLALRVKDLEFDPATVIAYERQNENRDTVIEALEKLLPDHVPDEELVVKA